ncbi:DUF3793 family protein [Candidatus Viridilinea mediisalina]|uniref:DUF3793 domain-containing protein n=1 Tax=Candidatus Viridilinea mediisalina TaxID=2024553 RepID=A0A2A6RHN8_9CHLR|nr:DUF3793 family protein [Candidatus Viridilinea mediisalina]PDW02399.1 hypothetical protein CJ255_14085 [Candidatus Viridilinea mediisalina]
MHPLRGVPLPVIHWKTRVTQLPTTFAEFEKWLFVSVASVLLGGKAGELLTLPHAQFDLSIAIRLRRIATCAAQWGCAQHVLKQCPGSTKVIVYNPKMVQAALHEVTPCFFCELGYAPHPTPHQFLAEVAHRWHEKSAIPHEIGLALGYPVKDVLGFMGWLPLDCSGCCGWRIYGDPEQSLERSRNFAEARRQALHFLYTPA